jgi:hypothetical protein
MKNQLPFLPYLFSIILSIGLVAVFLQLSAVLSRIEFESGRIDNLEKRPVSLVDQLVESDNKPSPSPIVSTKTTAQVVATASTPTSQTPKPTITPTPSTLGTKLLTYLPIYGSHTTIDSAWSDVPGSEFVISSQEIASASLYFEAIASVEAGSGEARIRIYDTKNNIVVNGSEIVTTSSTPSLVRSGRLSMWSGENTYKLQLSSKVPTPARFYFGRIKIVYN